MPKAVFRFYAELNIFLPMRKNQRAFELAFNTGQTVKHLVESAGVPHTEIDLILANGGAVDFSYRVKDGDYISIFPVFESFDISSLACLRPQPLRQVRFVLDAHLGRLAAYLRMVGFDTLYRNDYDDAELAEISFKEKRLLLTRDRGLLKRRLISHGYYVRAVQPRLQLEEVLHRFQLSHTITPFARCLRCNALLQQVDKETVLDRLEDATKKYYDEFYACPGCGQIYWKGSHYLRMKEMVEKITGRAV